MSAVFAKGIECYELPPPSGETITNPEALPWLPGTWPLPSTPLDPPAAFESGEKKEAEDREKRTGRRRRRRRRTGRRRT
eukprot:8021642-Pyramimonas_sp.AAC.1